MSSTPTRPDAVHLACASCGGPLPAPGGRCAACGAAGPRPDALLHFEQYHGGLREQLETERTLAIREAAFDRTVRVVIFGTAVVGLLTTYLVGFADRYLPMVTWALIPWCVAMEVALWFFAWRWYHPARLKAESGSWKSDEGAHLRLANCPGCGRPTAFADGEVHAVCPACGFTQAPTPEMSDAAIAQARTDLWEARRRRFARSRGTDYAPGSSVPVERWCEQVVADLGLQRPATLGSAAYCTATSWLDAFWAGPFGCSETFGCSEPVFSFRTKGENEPNEEQLATSLHVDGVPVLVWVCREGGTSGSCALVVCAAATPSRYLSQPDRVLARGGGLEASWRDGGVVTTGVIQLWQLRRDLLLQAMTESVALLRRLEPRA